MEGYQGQAVQRTQEKAKVCLRLVPGGEDKGSRGGPPLMITPPLCRRHRWPACPRIPKKP